MGGVWGWLCFAAIVVPPILLIAWNLYHYEN